jgi:hypothetical protein
MKNKTLLIYILLNMTFLQAVAGPNFVGTSFTFQGELEDNGSPANNVYDIIFDAYNFNDSGDIIGSDSLVNVQVTNGYFEVPDLDFGYIYNNNEVWIQLSIRKSSAGGPYTPLLPRLRVGAVPNAVIAQNVISGGEGATQWNDSANGIYYPGRVGIGTTEPLSKLEIDSNTGTNALKININGSSKLSINDDGSSNFYADVKQSNANGGIMKFSVYALCSDKTSNIDRFYNGIPESNDPITITGGGTTGKCIITFPSNIESRFWIAHAVRESGNRGVTCINTDSNQLTCTRFNTSTGVGFGGDIIVLVF